MASRKQALAGLAKLGLGALFALLAAASCGREQSDPTGGETHFLTRCGPDSKACGGGLTCLCGVCTLACDARATCQDLPDAACVASSDLGACGESDAAGHCDVACIGDDDCALLSRSHVCENGVCRAGAEPPAACVHGEVSPNQVLLIGDAFFASSHQVTAYLEDIARSSGVLPTGERYRDNSHSIQNGLALAGNGIASQYDAGTSESEVRVVLMNGGGADVLLGSCDTADANCPLLVDAASAASELLTKMGADGVQHVIYAFYPDPTDAGVRAKMDALRPLVQEACEGNVDVACHWLDLRASFAGRYDELIQSDGLNPTAAGSQVTARAIWDFMQQYCVAQ